MYVDNIYNVTYLKEKKKEIGLSLALGKYFTFITPYCIHVSEAVIFYGKGWVPQNGGGRGVTTLGHGLIWGGGGVHDFGPWFNVYTLFLKMFGENPMNRPTEYYHSCSIRNVTVCYSSTYYYMYVHNQSIISVRS